MPITDAIGLTAAEILKRKKCVDEAWNLAKRDYLVKAVVAHTSQEIFGLLGGVLTMLVGSVVVILIGNVGGAAIGGAIGAFVGGAGAAPGAAIGRTVGHAVAMGLLTLVGVKFLIEYVGSQLGLIGEHFMEGVNCAWDSSDFNGRLYEARMQYAAKHMAEGFGIFCACLIIAIILYLTRNKAKEKGELLNSKLATLCDGLVTHVIRNIDKFKAKYANGVLKATVTEGLPKTPEGLAEKAKAAAGPVPFNDIPNFANRSAASLRQWLETNGFKKMKEMERPGSTDSAGRPNADFKSEIWVRQRPGSARVECVRIDVEGHVPGNPKSRTGPIKIHGRDGNGTVQYERRAWGERPHYHLESIVPGEMTWYLDNFVAQAIKYTADAKTTGEYQAAYQRAKSFNQKVFGRDGEVAVERSVWEMIHIPLAP